MKSAVRLVFLCVLSTVVGYAANAATPLTLGATYAGSINLPGQTNAYTFTGTPGQRLFLDSQNAQFAPMTVTFYSPGGTALYQFNDLYDGGPWILTEPGTYSLVFNGNGSTTGTYQFRLLDLSLVPPLTLGTPLSDQLNSGLACNIYQFNGKRGQRVSFQALAFSTNQLQWQLLGPANALVIQPRQIYQDLGTVTLPIDGPYFLMLLGTAAGNTPITFQLLATDVSDTPVSVSGFGTTHGGTVNANQTNSFTYTAPAGLPVYFNSLDRSGVSLAVDLMDPTGNVVPGLYGIGEVADAGPFVLPRSGTYTLNVRGPGGSSGNFNFRLLDLTASPVLSLNSAVSNVLATPYQTDVYQFTGTPGQRLYHDSLLATFVNVSFRVIGPDGQYPFQASAYSDVGPVSLPAAGTYYLFEQSGLATGPAYAFQLLDIAAQPVLPLNTDITGTLVPNSSQIYHLAGTAGQQLYFNGKGVTSGGASWTLYDGHNTQVGGGAGLASDFEVTLPYNSDYALLLVNGANSVSYSNQVNAFAFTTNALSLGAVVTNSIIHPGDQVVYTFNGTAGQRVYYDATSPSFLSMTFSLVSPTGIQVTSGNPSSDNGPVTLPESGIYRLIFNGNSDTTGPFSFRLSDLAAQPALPLNTDLTGALDANVSQIFQLAGTQGQHLYFNSKAVTGGGASWTLYGPDNGYVGGAGLAGDFELTLANAGTYALVFTVGANPVTYSNQVNTFSYTTNALTLGTAVTNNITNPGDQVFYSFTGTAGQRVYFDSLNPNYFASYVTLISPTGQTVASGNSTYDFGPVTLEQSGVYLLQFDGSGDATGGISFQMLDIAAQPALPLNTDLSGTLAPNTSIIYQLPGVAGEQLYFNSKGITASGAAWTLYDPNNLELVSQAFSGDFSEILPNSGNYVVVFQNAANTVGYSNQVNSFSSPTNGLTLSSEVTATIVHPGDQLYYTFQGTPGQRVYFDSRQIDYVNMQVSLLSPTAVQVFSGNPSYDAGPFTLMQAGTYTLVLDGLGDTTGSVAFNLLDLSSASTVNFGATVSDSLSDRTETRLYRFSGTAGQRVNLQSLGSGDSQATWELFNLTDQALGATPYISQNIGAITLPAAGNYVVAVVGYGTGSSSVPYQWTLSDVSDSPVTSNGFGTVNSGTVAANQTNSFTYTAPAGLPVFYDSQDISGQNLAVDLISPDGSLVFSLGESSDSSTPYVLPRSGTYTLQVRGYNGASGNFSFRLVDLTASPNLPLNTPVSGTLNNPYETDIYQFTTSAGEVLIYDALTNDVNYPSVSVSMLNPAWQYIGPNNDFQVDRGPFVVQYNGTSYLLVRNAKSSSNPYSFQVLDVAAQPVLPVGPAITNTLGIYPLQVYRYSGTAGQQLFFNALGAIPSGAWTVYDPNNNALSGSGVALGSPFEVTLPYTGVYSLVLLNYGNTAGADAFQVNAFTYSTNNYTLGSTVVDSISVPGQRKTYTFNGTLGQRLVYDALTNDVPSGSIIVGLLNPLGQPESPIGGRFIVDRGPFTLQESGTFTLTFDGSGSTTGAFAFRLLDVSAQPVIPVNSGVTNTLDSYALQVYQHSGTAGQRLYFHGDQNNPAGYWTLFDPSNAQAGSGSSRGDFEVILPLTGTYTLLLGSYGPPAGAEIFQVNDYVYLTNAYTMGTAVIDSITKPGEQHYYTFTGTLGQQLVYNALTNDPPSPNVIYVQLYNPLGASEGPIGGRFSNNRGPFTLQHSGTYTLVFDGSLASTGAYAFQLLDVAKQPVLPISTGVTNALGVFPLEVYQYTGLSGQHMYFRGFGGNPFGNWSLFDPDNNLVGSASLAGDFELTLSLAGTYALVVGNNSSTAATEIFAVNPFNGGETLSINSAPVLSHIGSQVLAAGIPVTFTAHATDPDNNALTFSLDPGGPLGASIDPVTGDFTWVPPLTGFSIVTNVTVRVSDNGIPSLSAAETVQIEVIAGPTMITVSRSGSTATVYYHSAPGKHYQLQYKNELSDPWQLLGGSFMATDVITAQLDTTIGVNAHRFYRIEALDPL